VTIDYLLLHGTVYLFDLVIWNNGLLVQTVGAGVTMLLLFLYYFRTVMLTSMVVDRSMSVPRMKSLKARLIPTVNARQRRCDRWYQENARARGYAESLEAWYVILESSSWLTHFPCGMFEIFPKYVWIVLVYYKCVK